MMAKCTIQTLALGLVFTLTGAGYVFAQNEAPLAPRPFTPVGQSESPHQDYSQPTPYSNYSTNRPAARTVESDSVSRFQMDGTEKGSYASKDPQAYNANSTRDHTQATPRPVAQSTFRASAPVRTEPRTGYSVGIYGGINAVTEVDGNVRVPAVPNSILVDLNSSSNPGMTGGLKFRYTWPFDEEPIEQWRDEVGGEGFRLSGALEGELGYVAGELDGTAGATTATFDYDAFTFMVNAYLVLQAGKWRPYAGVGGGGAALWFDGGGTASDDAVSLAYQGILGVDYFLSSDWSLFAEYKYLVFDEIGDLYLSSDISEIEQHLFTLGARKHF
jgi:opacity protein-like surface antigen